MTASNEILDQLPTAAPILKQLKYKAASYIPVVMPIMAKSTQDRYKGVIKNYLVPAFGELCLRDLSRLTIQRYFSKMPSSPLARESKDKIKDVLSSILGSAVEFELLAKNPSRECWSARAKNRPQTN